MEINTETTKEIISQLRRIKRLEEIINATHAEYSNLKNALQQIEILSKKFNQIEYELDSLKQLKAKYIQTKTLSCKNSKHNLVNEINKAIKQTIQKLNDCSKEIETIYTTHPNIYKRIDDLQTTYKIAVGDEEYGYNVLIQKFTPYLTYTPTSLDPNVITGVEPFLRAEEPEEDSSDFN